MSIESPFLSREEEYSVSGWVGTLGVMRCIANASDFQKEGLVGQNHLMMTICELLNDRPEEGIKEVKRLVETPTLAGERDRWLQEVGISKNYSLDPDFMLALQITSYEDFAAWLKKETTFGRLSDSIEFHSNYQANRVGSAQFKAISLSDEIRLSKREIEYYVGHEDPFA